MWMVSRFDTDLCIWYCCDENGNGISYEGVHTYESYYEAVRNMINFESREPQIAFRAELI